MKVERAYGLVLKRSNQAHRHSVHNHSKARVRSFLEFSSFPSLIQRILYVPILMKGNSITKLCDVFIKSVPAANTQIKGWIPKRKLDPEAMQLVRNLYQQSPTKENRIRIAEEFGISYEAVKRICKSRFSRVE